MSELEIIDEKESTRDQKSQCHDIIGKPLTDFKTITLAENYEIPKVLFIIYKYFLDEDLGLERIKTYNLFKIKPDQAMIDNLDKHISLGNYNYLLKYEDPTIVAQYLKSIFKCMEEPLCKYQFYDKFKALSLNLYQYEQSIQDLNALFNQYDKLTYNTWHFLVHLLSKFIDY